MNQHHSIPLLSTLVGGVLASAGIIGANQLVHAVGRTDLDLLKVLGLTFRRAGQAGVKPAGLIWYLFTGGVVVPLLYWLGLRLMGRAGPMPGLLLGVVHYFGANALLALTDTEPSEASTDSRGEGRAMGAFLRHYGSLEQVTNVLAHLGYGMTVGIAAGRRHV